MSGSIQEPPSWNYDFDPVTGLARATFPGVVQIQGLSTPSLVRTIPRIQSLTRTWLPQCQNWVTVTAAQYTVASLWGLESDYSLVRLIYGNNAANAYTISLAKVSPSSALGDGHSPVNAAGAQDFTMFVPVTFNNAGADVQPQDQTAFGSGTTSFTVPANAGNLNQPTRWYSDWARVQSLARTDGGANPLLLCRHLTDSLGTYRCTNMLPAQGVWNNIALNRPLIANYKLGLDSVTTPGLIPAPTNSLQFLTPDGVQYVSSGSPGFSVLGVGDSLTRGFGSSTTFDSWAYLSAMALSTPSRPISHWNQGWQGQQSPDFWANGYTAFKGCKPDVVTIAVWSPNDGLTQAAADAAWSRAMDFAQYAARNGAVPVLMGPCPWSGITTGAQETARLSARTRMLNAMANGMLGLDWENVIGTGASPNRIQPGLVAADNQHPNDAGNALMDTQVFRPVLARILQR